MKETYKKDRVHGIDFIRGLAVINMVIYHLLYDLVYVFDKEVFGFSVSKAYIWQQAIVITFVFISGISCFFSRHNIKRGIKIFGLAMVLSAATYIVLPEEFIAFGILHFLGLSIIVFGLLKKSLEKVPSAIGAGFSFFVFLVTKGVSRGFIGVADIKIFELPYQFYNSKYLFWLGFPNNGFFSGDYVPIFPWFFMLLFGCFSWKLVYNSKYLKWFSDLKFPVINDVGKKALWIYMLHQPIIYGMLLLIY